MDVMTIADAETVSLVATMVASGLSGFFSSPASVAVEMVSLEVTTVIADAVVQTIADANQLITFHAKQAPSGACSSITMKPDSLHISICPDT